MATESLIISVNEKGALVVRRNLENIGKGARKGATGVDLLKRAVAALGGAAVIKGAVNLVDEFQRLENRVRIALDGQGDYNKTLSDLFGIANEVRGPVEQLVSLYQRGAIAADQLNVSQAELLDFTRTIGKALAIQGGGAQEARGALIQLSQSLGAGIVRAEEFNAILEGAFPIALAAAKGLDRAGGSVALLRREIIDGKVTSEEFFRAIMSQSDELARQFEAVSPTIGQSFLKLNNALIQTVGRFSQATGLGQALVDTISGLADFISESTPVLIDFGRAITGTLEPEAELTSGTQLLASAVVTLTLAFNQLVNSLVTTVSTAFKAVGNQIGGIAAGIALALDGEFELAGQTIAESFDDTGDIVVASAETLRADLVGATTDTIEQLAQIWDQGARLSAAAQQRLFEAPQIADVDTGGGGAGGGMSKELENLIDKQKDLLVTLAQEAQAFAISQVEGREFADVLEEIQIAALGAQGGLAGFTETALAQLRTNRELNQALEERNALLEEGRVLTEAVRTPTEIFNDTIQRQKMLFQEGAISAETFARAVRAAFETLQDTQELTQAEKNLEDFFRRARENAQDILGDALANAFTSGLDDLPRRFAQVLLELSSQFLASEIFRLLGNLGQNSSGGFLKSLGSFFAGSFASGGQFQVPGSGGTDSQLMMARVTPRETVTIETPAQRQASASAQAAPIINLPPPQVVVVDDERRVTQVMQGERGTKTVLNMVRENRRAFQEALQ